MRTGPVGVTGARGRVGRALVAQLRESGLTVIEWLHADYDLDDPAAAERIVRRDRPAMVYHLAAWTDVDACARQPDVAARRNHVATAELAGQLAMAGASLVFVSTNEVFNGRRDDGQGYREDDRVDPINAYGRSKADGESAARDAFSAGRGAGLWIVRSSWIFGPPGADFPAKILAAADRLPEGESLPVVTDEFGRPTAARDLAGALLRLPTLMAGGTVHIAGKGVASRFEWASHVLNRCRPDRLVRPTTQASFQRASTPPSWGVLDTARADSVGLSQPDWREATDRYARQLCSD